MIRAFLTISLFTAGLAVLLAAQQGSFTPMVVFSITVPWEYVAALLMGMAAYIFVESD